MQALGYMICKGMRIRERLQSLNSGFTLIISQNPVIVTHVLEGSALDFESFMCHMQVRKAKEIKSIGRNWI